MDSPLQFMRLEQAVFAVAKRCWQAMTGAQLQVTFTHCSRLPLAAAWLPPP